MFIKLSKGTLARLERIKELKGYSKEEALDFAIAIGWLAAEKQAKENKIKDIVQGLPDV